VDDEPIPTVPKPDALLALHDVTTELFETLRQWFAVPGEVVLNLHGIDSAVHELGDPLMIAALAMRKLQALHLLSTPGVVTTTDVVVTIVQDLDRALIQAPNMHLKLQAAAADWDAELADLGAPPDAAVTGKVANTSNPLATSDNLESFPDDDLPVMDDVTIIDEEGEVLHQPSVLDDVPLSDDVEGAFEPDELSPTDEDDEATVDNFEASLAGLERSLEGLNDQLEHELALLHEAADGDDVPTEVLDDDVPVDPGQADPAVERFRALHAKLHEAAYAVMEVSEGEIRYLA